MTLSTLRSFLSFAGYVMALGVATHLTLRGVLPSEVIASLLGVAVPTPWMFRDPEAKST